MSEEEILKQIKQKQKEIENLVAMLPKDSISFVTIANQRIPNPNFKSGKQTVSTAVDSGINGNNVWQGTKLGRDRSKLELDFGLMKDTDIKSFLTIFENSFTNMVTYYDMQKGWITREMYVGDRTGTPLHVNRILKTTDVWADVKANLIDTGRGA